MLDYFVLFLESLRSGSRFNLIVSNVHAKALNARKRSSLFLMSVGLQERNQQNVSEQVCDKIVFHHPSLTEADCKPG